MRITDQLTGCNADTPPWECWSRGWKVPYLPVSSTSLEFLSSKATQIHRNCEAIFWEAERSQTRILTIQNFPNNRNHLESLTGSPPLPEPLMDLHIHKEERESTDWSLTRHLSTLPACWWRWTENIGELELAPEESPISPTVDKRFHVSWI